MFKINKEYIWDYRQCLDTAQVNLGDLEVDWGLPDMILNIQEGEFTIRKALFQFLPFGKGHWSYDGLKGIKIILLSKNPLKIHPSSHFLECMEQGMA